MMTEIKNGVSWVHRLAALVAIAAFCTIVMGTLVASSADSPAHLQFTSGVFEWSSLSGGIKYEPAYRILAAGSGLLAAGLAIILLRNRAELYVRILGLINAMAGGLQLALSGITASPNHTATSVAFSTCVGETFFALSVCLAFFTRTDWNWNQPKTADVASPSFRSLLVFTSAVALAVSVLGTQTHPSVFPHLLGGSAVTLASLWAVEIALNKFPGIPGVKIPAILLAELTVLQVFIGLVAHAMVLNARASSLPVPGLTVIIPTHSALGALVLAASLYTALQAFKYLAPRTAKSLVSLPADSEVEVFDPE